MPILPSLLLAGLLTSFPTPTLQRERLTPIEQFQRDQIANVQRIRDRIAKAKKEPVWKVQPADIQGDGEFKALGVDERTQQQFVQAALTTDLGDLPPVANLSGYSPVNFASGNPVLRYSVRKPLTSPTDTPGFVTVKDTFGGGAITQIVHLKITAVPPTQPGVPAAAPLVVDQWIGPVLRKTLDAQIDQVKKQNAAAKIEILGQGPMQLYSDVKGHLLWVVDAGVVPNPSLIRQGMDMTYFKIPVSDLTPVPGGPPLLTPTYTMAVGVRAGK